MGPKGDFITLHYRHMKETERDFDTWWFEETETTTNIQNINQKIVGNFQI
jgi:hypothetical protein